MINIVIVLTSKYVPKIMTAGSLRFSIVIDIERDLAEARAQWNVDWFRRLMRALPKAVIRLKRRWEAESVPDCSFRGISARYHANIAVQRSWSRLVRDQDCP